MKFFAFIMAILVLVLSCMPCTDEAYALNGNKAKAEFSKSQNPSQEDHSDDCSPLCSCNCCAGVTFTFASYNISYFAFLSVTKNAELLPVKLSEISLPVWQPPQLL